MHVGHISMCIVRSFTGLVVMIIVNNIRATPLVITMVAVTMVTTVLVEVVAVDHLIGGTELTSDSDNIFCIILFTCYLTTKNARCVTYMLHTLDVFYSNAPINVIPHLPPPGRSGGNGGDLTF